MNRLGHLVMGAQVALLLCAATAQAQTKTGDGLTGAYYEGTAFERLVFTRRDPTIAFDWAMNSPAAGVPPEYFSVRWTGWLVPPATGRYVFHVTVDDGMRIWLNDRLILNEWRPQPVSRYAVAVVLHAGEPYRLRVDYFQDILNTRAKLTWELPGTPLAPPPASWRNFWGRAAAAPGPEPVATRFLFSRPPPASSPAAVFTPAKAAEATPPAPQAAPTPAKPPAKTPPLVRRAASASAKRDQPRTAKPQPGSSTGVSDANLAPAADSDSSRARKLVRLTIGEILSLPEVRFDQGQAWLLPSARAVLDELATALLALPTLRLEVQGHTDNVGNPELNVQLSQRRAEAVCQYLVTKGISPGQLHPAGYGDTRPVADNAQPTLRARNRRVVLVRQ